MRRCALCTANYADLGSGQGFIECVRSIRRVTHREPAGEVPVRTRRILQESVPQPAHEVWEATPPTALAKDRQLTSHRAAILRAAGGEDAHRDPHQGHAALREFVLMAVHGDHVTHDVEAAGGGMIHALRLPAVSAEPAVRPVPEVPA
ncbi:hypothetical protein O3G_MSEX004251 [Manduca sexta]|uniref:Uncharacterized protein n=1 Tax=Manduca sexta TaxID=7130 RepID=A0A922CHG2_MANSE|nr:hypothetical protein O3G_MSEX004251 [Manduca sexta]